MHLVKSTIGTDTELKTITGHHQQQQQQQFDHLRVGFIIPVCTE